MKKRILMTSALLVTLCIGVVGPTFAMKKPTVKPMVGADPASTVALPDPAKVPPIQKIFVAAQRLGQIALIAARIGIPATISVIKDIQAFVKTYGPVINKLGPEIVAIFKLVIAYDAIMKEKDAEKRIAKALEQTAKVLQKIQVAYNISEPMANQIRTLTQKYAKMFLTKINAAWGKRALEFVTKLDQATDSLMNLTKTGLPIIIKAIQTYIVAKKAMLLAAEKAKAAAPAK